MQAGPTLSTEILKLIHKLQHRCRFLKGWVTYVYLSIYGHNIVHEDNQDVKNQDDIIEKHSLKNIFFQT